MGIAWRFGHWKLGKCHWPLQAALSGSIIKAPGFAGGYLLRMKSFAPLLGCQPEKGANTDTEIPRNTPDANPFFRVLRIADCRNPRAAPLHHREPSGACPAAGRAPRRRRLPARDTLGSAGPIVQTHSWMPSAMWWKRIQRAPGQCGEASCRLAAIPVGESPANRGVQSLL